jgi:indoleamine 2,3-dioxygenase
MILDTIPSLHGFAVSLDRGFLPQEYPLEVLPDTYYASWEAVITKLSKLLQEGRLRDEIDALPVLSTANLRSEPEWQRAYVVLAFFTHAYIWGGETPSEVCSLFQPEKLPS